MPRRGTRPPGTRFQGPAERANLLLAILAGQLDCTGTCTFAAGTVATVVPDRLFSATTVLLTRATTAAGAALDVWQTAAAKGSVTLGHDAPGADAPMRWVAIG